MEDMAGIGGIPAVIKYLLAKGRLHGGTMTVTGKTPSKELLQTRLAQAVFNHDKDLPQIAVHAIINKKVMNDRKKYVF
jgi:dihydroxyacid dehydratase/phosphogluconate dehydratase